MSARPAKKAKPAIAPAPSVLDAVNASRGGRPAAVAEPAAAAPVVKAPVATEPAAADTVVQITAPEPEPVVEAPAPEPAPSAESGTAEVTAALRKRRARSEAIIAEAVPSSSVDELGAYVTRIMVDARRAASEFLASVDVDAARRAAAISAQAEIEAESLRAAAMADADKIRADARLEADRLVAQRLRIAIDLTDRLYGQADQILADADRPDIARRNLARFVTALTQTAEDAAAASVADESRS